MENNIEDLDSQNQDDEFIVNKENETESELGLPADPEEVEPQDDEVEDVSELKQRLQSTYEQLKKAKGFKRDPKTGKWIKPEPKEPKIVQQDKGTGDITIMELKSLLAANIHDDSDSEEVRLYARSHNMSITEALKMPEVKSMLRTRIEIRKSEEAMSANSRRGSVKTAKDYLDLARKGEEVDPEKLAEARQQEKLSRFNS